MVKVHFLNVGHGDCMIIEHNSGRITMIDVNNGQDLDRTTAEELYPSFGLLAERIEIDELIGRNKYQILAERGYDIALTNPIEYLKDHYPGADLFRYIQTHPDLDHMRGLLALGTAGIGILNFWDTEHGKTPEFQSDADEQDWKEYESYSEEKKNNKCLHLYRGDCGAFWNEEPKGVAGGDGISILSPTKELVASANEAGDSNNLSYVIRLRYQGVTVIFGADAGKDVWEDLVDTYGEQLKCHVLKASHHGRDTGYHQDAVKLMSPEYTIVSVGKKPENDASNKYRQYSKHVWSTRWKGNITLEISDDGKGTINSEYDR